MIQNRNIKDSLPDEARNIILQLGKHIRIARKRRAITMKDMASRMFVQRKTLSRLEKGDPAVSFAVVISALWVLGLEKNLLGVAKPENDKVGIFREQQRLPKKVRGSISSDDLDF